MAEFDQSEHPRPDAVVDSAYEDFDVAADLDRRRLAMMIGLPLIVLVFGLAAGWTIRAHDQDDAQADHFPAQLELRARAPEAPILLPQSTNAEMVVALQQMQSEQLLNNVDLAPGAVRANPADDPWFLGSGLLWLVLPILAVTLLPILRSRRLDPA